MRNTLDEVDLLVFGSGVAGMTTALIAAHLGLRVLLCEKTDRLGGTTSTSGGSAWVVGTSQAERAGVPDSIEAGKAYLDDALGTHGGEALRAAFLETGAEAIDFLENNTEVSFAVPHFHPDYYPDKSRAARGGRNLAPKPFDGRRLKGDFLLIRPPRDEFLALGGMAIGRHEVDIMVRPWKSWRAFRTATSLVFRHARDRLRHPRGTRLLMGNALIGRLLYSLRQKEVSILTGATLVDLVVEAGRVVGAAVEQHGAGHVVRARRGVVLATGGFAANPALRRKFLGSLDTPYTVTFEGAQGEGIEAARRIGAEIGGAPANPGLWMPASILRRQGKPDVVFPHLRDRAKPGLIAVNSAGRRFVNEANSYHDVVTAMFREHENVPTIPAYLICDRSFVRDFGLGLVRPLWSRLGPFIDAGYLFEAPTITELAGRIRVDPDGLAQTIERHNRDAASGHDTAFGRGDSDLNRLNGSAGPHPNLCMRPIAVAPFYAVAIYPAPLATSLGIVTNPDAQVLDKAGVAISGLYAVGNDMASVFRGLYPGPGATIGPAIAFAYRAGRHAAAHPYDPRPAEQAT